MKPLTTVEEATRLVREAIYPLDSELVPLAETAGRILREPLRADRDLPPYDRVMMDGYAMCSASWIDGQRSYRLSGEQPAGSVGAQLASSQDCMEVATGAVLPEGSDVVLPVEWSEQKDGNIVFKAPDDIRVDPWLYVHRRGSDHSAGTDLVPIGSRLCPAEVAIAATCGYPQLKTSRRPKVAILGTGEELVPVEEAPASYQIRESNVHALAAFCLEEGLLTPETAHSPDDPLALRDVVERLTESADMLIFTGGVSKGRKDYLPGVLEECRFEKIFHGVSQTPGKPMWFGKMSDGPIAFGLPGNPVSAVVGFVRYAKLALWALQGFPDRPQPFAELADSVDFVPAFTRFLPVRLEEKSSGIRRALPRPPKNSGDLAALVGTDGFVELPAEKETFPTGYPAAFFPW
ncbi:MAG: molybdopterin molybdotransferase MoeA [Opitutales bacterium]